MNATEKLAAEYEVAAALVKEHQTKQGIFHCSDTLADRIRSVMQEYEDTAAGALRSSKEFRDRLMIDLRAISLVLTMVGNADTHREKNARLRGSIELIEGAISRLAKEEFDIQACRRPHFDDPFRSDYPTRHLVERIHQLEDQLKQQTPQS